MVDVGWIGESLLHLNIVPGTAASSGSIPKRHCQRRCENYQKSLYEDAEAECFTVFLSKKQFKVCLSLRGKSKPHRRVDRK